MHPSGTGAGRGPITRQSFSPRPPMFRARRAARWEEERLRTCFVRASRPVFAPGDDVATVRGGRSTRTARGARVRQCPHDRRERSRSRRARSDLDKRARSVGGRLVVVVRARPGDDIDEVLGRHEDLARRLRHLAPSAIVHVHVLFSPRPRRARWTSTGRARGYAARALLAAEIRAASPAGEGGRLRRTRIGVAARVLSVPYRARIGGAAPHVELLVLRAVLTSGFCSTRAAALVGASACASTLSAEQGQLQRQEESDGASFDSGRREYRKRDPPNRPSPIRSPNSSEKLASGCKTLASQKKSRPNRIKHAAAVTRSTYENIGVVSARALRRSLDVSAPGHKKRLRRVALGSTPPPRD